MKNFLLWDFSFAESTRTLSFFATMVNLQRIHQGTRTMISQMLADAHLSEIAFADAWQIQHFFTDYLADDPESSDWEDIWLDTWEIRLHTMDDLTLGLASTNLVHTRAYDETWQGDPSSGLPGECVVIADFYNLAAVEQAQQVLITDDTYQVRRRAGLPQQLLLSLGTVDEEFFTSGASAAQLLMKRVHELGGTTTWEERTTPA